MKIFSTVQEEYLQEAVKSQGQIDGLLFGIFSRIGTGLSKRLPSRVGKGQILMPFMGKMSQPLEKVPKIPYRETATGKLMPGQGNGSAKCRKIKQIIGIFHQIHILCIIKSLYRLSSNFSDLNLIQSSNLSA